MDMSPGPVFEIDVELGERPDAKHDERARRPSQPLWYWSSSFTYAMVGIFMFMRIDILTTNCACDWPWYIESRGLILQGFLSYMNDVHYFGGNKFWRCTDILFATSLAICQPLKLFLVPMDVIQVAIIAVGFLSGLYSLRRAKVGFKQGNLRDFMIWHALWHYSFPSAGVLFIQYTS